MLHAQLIVLMDFISRHHAQQMQISLVLNVQPAQVIPMSLPSVQLLLIASAQHVPLQWLIVLLARVLLLVHRVLLVITSLVVVLVAQVVFQPIATPVLVEIMHRAAHVKSECS